MPPGTRATFLHVTADTQETLSEPSSRDEDLREKMFSFYRLVSRLYLDVKFRPPEKAPPVTPPTAK